MPKTDARFARRSHGGKRANAGRKPGLPSRKRLEVGVFCEHEMWTIAYQEARRRLEDDPRHRQNAPLLERMQQIRSRFASRKTALTWDLELLSRRVDAVGRRYTTAIKRPKGVVRDILDQAARRFGITTRMARRCWDEFRRWDAKRRRLEARQNE